MAAIEFIEENGVLRVQGSKSRFFPTDKSYDFHLSSLTYVGRVWTLDVFKTRRDKPNEYHFHERMYGEALLRNSTLQVIGHKSRGATKASMSLIPIAEDQITNDERYWSGQLRFIDDQSSWLLSILVPKDDFAKVREVYSNGRLERLIVGLQVANAYSEEGQSNCCLKPDEEWNAWSHILVHDFDWYEVRYQLKTDRPDSY